MAWLTRIILISLVVFLEMSFLRTLLGSWPIPNFVLAAMLIMFLSGNLTMSLWWAGLGGFLLDLSLPGRGYFTLLLAALLLALTLIAVRFEIRLQGLLSLVAVTLAAAFFVAGEWLFLGSAWGWSWFTALLGQLIGISLVWLCTYFFQNSRFSRASGRLKIGEI